MHHPFLDAINIVLDPDLHALCCNICLVALSPSQVQNHLRNKHHGMKFNVDCFQKLVEAMGIPDVLPLRPVTDEGVPPFKGLKILDGFACGSCPLVLGTTKNMRTHQLMVHPEVENPLWSPCKMQQFNTGGSSRALWRVCNSTTAMLSQSSPQDAPGNVIIRDLRRQINLATASHGIPQDERVISPWLRFTKWHEHVAGHDSKTLMKLVEIPDKHDMDPWAPGIRNAIETYFNEALALLPVTEELILQRLNSPDPQSE